MTMDWRPFAGFALGFGFATLSMLAAATLPELGMAPARSHLLAWILGASPWYAAKLVGRATGGDGG